MNAYSANGKPHICKMDYRKVCDRVATDMADAGLDHLDARLLNNEQNAKQLFISLTQTEVRVEHRPLEF